MEVLAESLKQNTRVASVDLRWNKDVTDAGARALLFMLRANTALRRVTLADAGGAGTGASEPLRHQAKHHFPPLF